ncbi:hypothetical protein WI87_02210 [Burkholderia ubonensis]|nr:hypothetical protein WI87_02210 [Burkholderia ubonensis]
MVIGILLVRGALQLPSDRHTLAPKDCVKLAVLEYQASLQAASLAQCSDLLFECQGFFSLCRNQAVEPIEPFAHLD